MAKLKGPGVVNFEKEFGDGAMMRRQKKKRGDNGGWIQRRRK